MKSQDQTWSAMLRAKHLSPLELRLWAERRLARERRPRLHEEVDASRLLYELHVHDTELEIQNEELQRARIELEEALSRSQDMIDLAPVGYLQVNARGVIDAANWTACALFSMPLSDLVGREISSLALPEDASLLHGHIQYVAHNGARHSCDVRVLAPPDERRLLRFASAPGGSRASERSVCTAVIDVTEFKRVEEARRDHDLRRRAIEEASQDGIFVLDGSGIIIHSNGAASRVFGYSASELPGLDFANLVPAWRSLCSAAEAESASGTASPSHRAAALGARKEGTSFPLELAWIGLDDGSRRSTVVVRERSDDVFLESVFRRAEKMDAVGTLAAGIYHDVRNVLSGILCFAESALRQAANENVRADLEQIKEGITTAASVVQQLVRTVSTHTPISPQRLLVEPAIRRLEPLLVRVLGERITLSVKLCQRGAAIRAVAGDLEQILLNLVLNARDAVHDTGTVCVETEQCVLARGEDGPRSFVVLRVTDTGSGMDATTKAQLFHPFFTTKAESGGTGVGLMTVAATVKRLGGWIEVASRLGHGAVFTVYFPQMEASSPPNEGESLQGADSRAPVDPRLSGVVPKASHGRTVLVVDDDASTRAVLQRLLTDIDYRVYAAATVADALRIAERESIDVLLTDLLLREGRDDTLVNRLREQNSELAVIVVTGWPHAETDIAQKGAFAHPRTRVLSKPAEFDDIVHAIAELLGESDEASSESC